MKKKENPKSTKEIQDEYHKSIPKKDLNPKHKEDFEKVLKLFAPPIKPKAGKKK